LAKPDIEARLKKNLGRVHSLLNSYESAAGSGKGRRDLHKTDILRSATVFLHAALEDFLRSLEYWTLPDGSPADLNSIPLVGTDGRAEKFFLGALSVHRNKTVQNLIEESVFAYLQQKSYSDSTAVANTLQRMGVQTATIRSYLSSLDQLIERRHSIVHQADREDSGGSGHHGTRSISKSTVLKWTEAITSLSSVVLEQI
jgi:hypothetical protein